MGGRKKNAWQDMTALVTGASSGIGAAVAARLARGGLRVLITARRAERLEALQAEIGAYGGAAVVIPADLEDETERLALYARCQELGGVDVLVNNAGFGWYGYFSEMPLATLQSMLRVNLESVVYFTRLFLPPMLANGWGHVINIGSIAGSFPNQGVAAYSASKAYMSAFTTALYRELRGSGVHASLVLPGPVATEFFDTASERGGSGRIPAERFAVSVSQVANRTWSLLQRPRRRVFVPGWLWVVPWVEESLGWAVDLLGPLLLRRSRRAG